MIIGTIVYLRNPKHEERPGFEQICSKHLQQSSARMLYWNPEDNDLSPSVSVLGAPLENAIGLYMDLQNKYKQ